MDSINIDKLYEAMELYIADTESYGDFDDLTIHEMKETINDFILYIKEN